MYFEVSRQSNKNFPNIFTIRNFYVSTDLGWTEIEGKHGKIIFKGYAYTDLREFLKHHDPSNLSTPRGSFTAIMEKDNCIHIVHDNSRQYPIFVDKANSIVTNLTKLEEIKYPDVSITIDAITGTVNENYNKIVFEKKHQIDLAGACQIIKDSISNDIKFFAANYKDPIKIIPTGGIDSTLLIALLKYNNVDFEVIDYEYKKWTYFYKQNRKEVDENIPAKMFTKVGHSWGEEPTTLANGWHADQHMLRLYLPFVVFCKMKKLDIEDILEKYRDSYTYPKFLQKTSERRKEYDSISDLNFDELSGYNKIFEIIRASFQPWTFEKTCYWSPYKNLDITKTILHMADDHVVHNTMEATVQKNILSETDPNLLDVITPKKNEFNRSIYEHFTKTLTKY